MVGKSHKSIIYKDMFNDIWDFYTRFKDEIHWATEKVIVLIKNKFSGKTIAVIGPKTSGKTTFHKILNDPNYEIDVLDYAPTHMERLKSFDINFKLPKIDGKDGESIKFKLKKPIDIGGEESLRDSGEWLEVCKGADFVFYIMDVFKFNNDENYRNRVANDITWLAENNQVLNANFEVVIFCNKMDKFELPAGEDAWDKIGGEKIENMIKEEMGDLKDHVIHVYPISLLSKKKRVRIIGEALKAVAELGMHKKIIGE
jgi:signal recognition particle receptor subunit beta